jgi:glycosyltransferase involved in cell wall biosynthesis
MDDVATGMVDIVIPVYNEAEEIIPTLRSLASGVRRPFRVLICYDFDEDTTLAAIQANGNQGVNLQFVKNRGRGAHSAIMTGFEQSRAPYVLVLPADDNYNAGILDTMFEIASSGSDVVCASRFMPGGTMVGCPLLKFLLVRFAAFTLHKLGRLPTRDGTNGFRLFSRRLLDTVPIESNQGFTYSIELLAKCHRLGWPISETPAQWHERGSGTSRFRVIRWIPAYLRWYLYVFQTSWLSLSPASVLRFWKF